MKIYYFYSQLNSNAKQKTTFLQFLVTISNTECNGFRIGADLANTHIYAL